MFLSQTQNLQDIPVAIECARRSINMYIEKPLGTASKTLDRLLSLEANNKVSTYVAYVPRFHPVVYVLKEFATARIFFMRV